MNAAHRPTRLRAVLLRACACIVVAGPVTAAGPASGDVAPNGLSCISIAALAPLAGIEDPAAGTAQTKAPPDRTKQAAERRRERYRPMTRRELRTTLRALDPIRQKDGEWTIRAATSRVEVNYERMQVVYTDAIGLLTYLQAEDALAQLAELPGSDPQLQMHVEASFDRLGDCLQGRFEPWGGEETVVDMLDMIDEVRPRLNALIIKQLERRGGPVEPRPVEPR